jgi:hypothetical protein
MGAAKQYPSPGMVLEESEDEIPCQNVNLADRRELLAGGLDTVPTNSFIYTQPRTVGLAISRTF